MTYILTYDNTFDGFLSAVFHYYEHKHTDCQIKSTKTAQPSFFGKVEVVETNHTNAKRVWQGLEKYASKVGSQIIFKAFLSEIEGVEDILLHYIKRTFQLKKPIYSDYSDLKILQIAKIVKKVTREKHRMDAFVRFRLTKDNVYFATIAPDFNVLPLNKKHFESRYADQKWVIYDLKRNYGIYYDLLKTTTVILTFDDLLDPTKTSELYFSAGELKFQELWKNYFKSTNIKSRKNMKLHLQHVPKRYWKYLSEKAPLSKK